jgi:hypothetical protein
LFGSLIFVIVFGPTVFVLGGVSIKTSIEKTVVPNQGIWKSAKNIVPLSLLGVFISAFSTILTMPELPYLAHMILSTTIPFALLAGGACIKHFVLRIILYCNRYIPWNYARFLDYASERLLMKKVGGGYIFYHRMLMEHFAQMDRAKVSVSVIPESILHSVAKANPQTNVRSSNASNLSNPESQLSNPVQNHIVCSNCSHNNLIDGKFCTKCGRKLS